MNRKAYLIVFVIIPIVGKHLLKGLKVCHLFLEGGVEFKNARDDGVATRPVA